MGVNFEAEAEPPCTGIRETYLTQAMELVASEGGRVKVFVVSGGRSIGVVRDLAKVQAWVRIPSAAPFLWIQSFKFHARIFVWPIEFAAGGGKMWRRELTPFLHNELGHRAYDPAEDEKKSLTDEEATHSRNGKKTDVERFRRAVRKIIHFDLRLSLENKGRLHYLLFDGGWLGNPQRRNIVRTDVRSPEGNSGLHGDRFGCTGNRRVDAGVRRPFLSGVDELKKFLLIVTAKKNRPRYGGCNSGMEATDARR